jgi:hypothetical protein
MVSRQSNDRQPAFAASGDYFGTEHEEVQFSVVLPQVDAVTPWND